MPEIEDVATHDLIDGRISVHQYKCHNPECDARQLLRPKDRSLRLR